MESDREQLRLGIFNETAAPLLGGGRETKRAKEIEVQEGRHSQPRAGRPRSKRKLRDEDRAGQETLLSKAGSSAREDLATELRRQYGVDLEELSPVPVTARMDLKQQASVTNPGVPVWRVSFSGGFQGKFIGAGPWYLAWRRAWLMHGLKYGDVTLVELLTVEFNPRNGALMKGMKELNDQPFAAYDAYVARRYTPDNYRQFQEWSRKEAARTE